jgi:hypothetical protein
MVKQPVFDCTVFTCLFFLLSCRLPRPCALC